MTLQDALNFVEAADWAQDVGYEEGGRLCSVDGDEYLRLLSAARTLAYAVKERNDELPVPSSEGWGEVEHLVGGSTGEVVG